MHLEIVALIYRDISQDFYIMHLENYDDVYGLEESFMTLSSCSSIV